jgi:hypothetical protein
MRPTKTFQSALRAPLNGILGTEANVRLLRELVLADAPLARSEMAERSGMSLPGTSAAVEKLRRAAIVELVGTGGQQRVVLRAEHPLSGVLQTLFRAETSRFFALVDDLRAVAASAEGIRAAWIEGPVAEGSDGPNEPVVLAFLAGSRDVARLASALGEEVARIEREYDVTIEVRGTTEADLATLDADAERAVRSARSLHGPHPAAYTGGAPDAGAFEEPRSLADRLSRDPSLPKRARGWLVRRLHEASEQEGHALSEWLRLLDTASIPRLQHTLLSAGERSTRLRQSNPFLPVLTDAERRSLREETAH